VPESLATAGLSLVAEQSPDGRLARGERTRLRVVEALVSLIEEGDAHPTARSVAERAGVSLRLVFHHFKDMDAVYRAVIALQTQRHWARIRPVPAGPPLDERIYRTVRQRSRLFEEISPVRRTITALAVQSADIATSVAESNRLLRDFLAITFAEEIKAAPFHSDELLDALDLVTSWEAWERLRRGQLLGVAAAGGVLTRAVESILVGRSTPALGPLIDQASAEA
jgi:AcrR family transcriptional regulator